MDMTVRKDFNKRKELDIQTFILISKFIMAMKMHRLVNLRIVIMAGMDMLGAQTNLFIESELTRKLTNLQPISINTFF